MENPVKRQAKVVSHFFMAETTFAVCWLHWMEFLTSLCSVVFIKLVRSKTSNLYLN